MPGIIWIWIAINLTGLVVAALITREARRDYVYVRRHHEHDTYEFLLGKEYYFQGLLKTAVLFMFTTVGFMAIMPQSIRQHISLVLITAALVLTAGLIRDRYTMQKIRRLS